MPEHFSLTDRARTLHCWCDQYTTRPTDDSHADERTPRCGFARFIVSEVTGEPQQIETDATQTDPYLMMVVPLEGLFTVRVSERELHLGPGLGCLLSNGVSYAIDFRETFRQLHFCFHVDEISRLYPGWSRKLARAIDCSQGAGAMLKQSLQSALSHGRNVELAASRSIWRGMQHLMAATLMDSAFEQMQPAEPDRSALRTRIDQLIESELRNPELGVGLLTERLGISARHLHRVYATEQQTLMRTIREARLDRCYQDLTSAELRLMTINEIALSWGFNDQAHFSRHFRLRFGMTAGHARAHPGSASQGG